MRTRLSKFIGKMKKNIWFLFSRAHCARRDGASIFIFGDNSRCPLVYEWDEIDGWTVYFRNHARITTLFLRGPGLTIYKRGRRPSCPDGLVGVCMGGDQKGPSILLIF